MTRQTIRKISGIVGVVLLILSFFVLLYNPYIGWTLVTVSVVIIAASLYTNSLPRLKP